MALDRAAGGAQFRVVGGDGGGPGAGGAQGVEQAGAVGVAQVRQVQAQHRAAGVGGGGDFDCEPRTRGGQEVLVAGLVIVGGALSMSGPCVRVKALLVAGVGRVSGPGRCSERLCFVARALIRTYRWVRVGSRQWSPWDDRTHPSGPH